jgi:hypothetical protein
MFQNLQQFWEYAPYSTVLQNILKKHEKENKNTGYFHSTRPNKVWRTTGEDK